MPDLVFVKNPAAWDRSFLAPKGMVGRDIKKRARLVERAAKKQVGKDSRNLHGLIGTNMSRGITGPMATVGVTQEPGIGYAYFHHQGTRKHIIAARPGQHLRFKGRGAEIHVTEVMHPGTKANKFLKDNLPLAVV